MSRKRNRPRWLPFSKTITLGFGAAMGVLASYHNNGNLKAALLVGIIFCCVIIAYFVGRMHQDRLRDKQSRN